MRYILLFFLAYLVYKYLKPLLQKPVENPHVKGKSDSSAAASHKPEQIEDAEFEELE